MTCRQLIHALFILSLLIPLSAQAGTALSFPVTFSEPVNVTGSPRLSLDVGGVARYATYASGSGTTTLTFTYNTVVGDVDLDGVTLSSPLDLNGGTIKDLAGNDLTPLTFTLPNTANVKVDHPSLAMDFAANDFLLNGTHYGSLTSFLTAASGTFTRGSTATYYDASGVLQTAASGVARVDYVPATGVLKGLLLESSSSNLQTYSETIDNAAWGKSAITVTANATNSPAATTTAELAVPNTTNTYHSLNTGNKTTTASSYYTASIYAKPAGYTYAYINLTDPANHYAVFDISACTVGLIGASVTSTSAQSVGNGWCRISVTAQVSGTTANAAYHVTGGNNTSSFAGNGTSGIYFWGAQFEAGNFPTSYILTSATSVSRSADNITMPTGSWYNQAAGSFAQNSSWATTNLGTNYPMFWRVDDTTNNNRWNLYYNQASAYLGVDGYASGALQGSFSTSMPIAGSVKAAAAASSNNSNAAYNGVLKTLDTTWTMPAVTQFILRPYWGTHWLVSTKYYPLRVADTQLQLLSQ